MNSDAAVTREGLANGQRERLTPAGLGALRALHDTPAERIGATFVYAGIDVTTTPLFTGVRGAQLAGRTSLIDCTAFPIRLGDREPFRDLVKAMETAHDLRHHRP